jgi:hypothetical protein
MIINTPTMLSASSDRKPTSNKTMSVVLCLCSLLLVVTLARPFLTVPMCHLHSGQFQISHFQLDDGSGPAPAAGQTSARLCRTADALHVQWQSVDNDILSNFTACNEPLYKEDAVEIFLALDAPKDAPFRYVEFEVSPRGVLFNSLIDNKSGNCSMFSGTPLPCVGTDVNASATRTADGWMAKLEIPFLFLQLELGRNIVNSTIFGNLFRIDENRTGDRTYSAWIATEASPACFHKPRYFGAMLLQPIKSEEAETSTNVVESAQTDAQPFFVPSPSSASSSQAQFNFFFARIDGLLQTIAIAALLQAQL